MDEMNNSELLVNQTEEKMYYKFLSMIEESESLEELKKKIKLLLVEE